MSAKDYDYIQPPDTSIADAFNSPHEIAVMPLRNTTLFPQQVIPLYIGRDRSLRLLEKLSGRPKTIVVVAQKDGAVENPKTEDLYEVGTLAQILKIFDMPDKSKSAIVQGIERVRILNITQEDPYYLAEVQREKEEFIHDLRTEALTVNLRKIFINLVKKTQYLSEEHIGIIGNINEPGRLVDRIISLVNLPVHEKQSILEMMNVQKRLTEGALLLNKEIQRLEIGEKIQSEVQDNISRNQREYYLREQLKAIRKELGEDEIGMENQELRKKIEAAGLPEEVLTVAQKELTRLEKISPQSPEYTVSRTYLEWLTDLPWSKSTEDEVDTVNANFILEEDHYGLEKVKTRILEYLAVRKLKMAKDKNSVVKGPILCFIGPPGVGKTSMGKSIARSMGRKFYRMSLGGVRDEAEIRGHRRTYIGALPGRIIQGLKKAGSNNPVFMLDEIDKLGSDFRGDPSSALLEVLDPEQNFSFSDHYLEVPFDLRNVMFIATANWYDPIPGPLKDRMEILEFPGYTLPEKLNIARKFLISKQISEHGLDANDLHFTDEAIQELINNYTREAGVRNLEREIANICRKVAREKVEKKRHVKKLKARNVAHYLGKSRYFGEVAERMVRPGIAIGLAYTAVGGDILFIEASKMPGKGGLLLTGKLGDVMKESAQAALSFIRANAETLSVAEDFHSKYDIHIHIPAGAIPKDGPSAGVTLLTAIVSVLSGRKVLDNIGMTGEITLRGNVLPVGGIKEKVIAAHRAGLKKVILPERNRKDLEEIPQEVIRDIEFIFVNEMLELLGHTLEKNGQNEIKPDTLKPDTAAE
ncbi:MAG TPA: endopeptidase La [Candidatus Marinimicrobia bacterium]|nr:endopeptidase La [Candidatus Neomarinimicrobiota bacterium]